MQIPLSCSRSNKWKNKSSHKALPDNYRCDILKAYDPDRDQCFPAIETIMKVEQYLIKLSDQVPGSGELSTYL